LAERGSGFKLNLKSVDYDRYFSIELTCDDESTERMIALMKDIYK